MKKLLLRSTLVLFGGSLAFGSYTLYQRYAVSDSMQVAVTEYSNFEYPEDPALRSTRFGQYSGRKLTLVKKDDRHFDFILESTDPRVAEIRFVDVDVSVMTPSEPAWTKGDPGLERIALTDRQWNRQQVSFDPRSKSIEIKGGDGFERDQIISAELAKNCLNAGLWEVLLFTKENGKKALYYQNWFRFPLGHYKDIFEASTGVSYLKHWYKMEHWSDPEGEQVDLSRLRKVVSEVEVDSLFKGDERILYSGEQIRKRSTTDAKNVQTWSDMILGSEVRFAAFIPPGRYSVRHPWKNEYWRLAHFKRTVLRKILSPSSPKMLDELELVFEDKNGQMSRMIVSGVDFHSLPQLDQASYPEGLYMPMGIGVPPFYQKYEDLVKNPPDQSPYFSVLLDKEGGWINHHDVAIDGPVMHRDLHDPDLLHVYLLSYERHSLIGHYQVPIAGMSGSKISEKSEL